MAARKLGLGVVGLGRAFMLMRATFAASDKVALVAAADPRPEARAQFAAEFGGTGYEDLAGLLPDPRVAAVYIATPHQFHAEQAIAAAAAGKHVLVEKPMALSLAEAEAMIEAARQAKVKLIVGPSHSFDLPMTETRRLIRGGEFGPLKMITALNFTDFLYRPRRAEELDTAAGGGVVFNQAPHQVDIVRLLAGGLAESVTAQTGIWDTARPTEGAYNAMLRFQGDVAATITYSGHAHFDSDELMGWRSEMGETTDAESFTRSRRRLPADTSREAEEALRRQRGYGVTISETPTVSSSARWHEHFGFVIASCAKADLRPTPQGVFVYSEAERGLRPLPMPLSPRREVIEEFCAAVLDDAPVVRTGEWGLATLEASFAILQSARERRTVELTRQVALPPEF